MISFNSKGDFGKTEKFLKNAKNLKIRNILDSYGKAGVLTLSSATPVDTGEAAHSWGYNIEMTNKGFTITWTNSKMAGNVPLVILIQYGHATGTGGYIKGIDFINPAMKPIFNDIAKNVWREVTKL